MFPLLGLAAQYLIPLLGDAVSGLFSDDGSRKVAASVTTAVAQTAISAASQLTGIPISDEASIQQAAAALRDDAAKLAEYRRVLGEQVIQLLTLDNDDRASARQHDLAFLAAGKRNARADALIAIAVFGVIACVVTLVLGQVDGNTAVGGFVISVGTLLAGKVGTAFDFEFGSSAGSQAKDALVKLGQGASSLIPGRKPAH